MSTLTAAQPAQPATLLTVDSSNLPDPAQRGELHIDNRVVERVAGYAVTLVPDAVAAPRRVLGVSVGQARPEELAHVDADVRGTVATVTATIAVRWPRSVPQVAGQVRATVRGEVTRITGVEVDHVDLDVVSLQVPTRAARRVQ